MYGHLLHNAVARRLEARGFTYHPNRGPDFVHNRWGFQFEVTTRRQVAAHRAWSSLKRMLFPDSEPVVRSRGSMPAERVTGELRQARYEPPRGLLVNFEGATLVDVDLTNTRFQGLAASGSVFERCNFRAMVAEGGAMGGNPQVVYRDCLFERAVLGDVAPGNARFERCTFQDLRGWRANATEFVECRFLGRLEDVKFFGRPWDVASGRYDRLKPPRTVNEIAGNDFSQARLTDVDFIYGVDLSLQELPRGDECVRLSRLPERLASAQTTVEREWTGREREEALTMLSYFADPWQQELFVRRDIDLASREVRERVWDLLEHALD
jgi:hypothetical protein